MEQFDQLIIDIANYVLNYKVESELAIDTAYYCLLDSVGCGLEALTYNSCTRFVSSLAQGSEVNVGARVIGTKFKLDLINATFSNGALIRWLDFNDTWLASEWGHPSDNFAAILSVCDWLNANNLTKKPLLIKDVLTAAVKAYEIQGILALENSFNSVGLDHVILVKLASSCVACLLMELSYEQTLNAISLVFIDGQALRAYRHYPNTGSRKSWAAGDASSRGVKLALIAKSGEMGYPTVLSTPRWGFNDVLFKGNSIKVNRDFSSYVIENILFKVSYPAEFHAQTAVECAMKLHEFVKDRLSEIKLITIRTHKSAITIIDKSGPLKNPADRDHCIQYMVSIALIYGRLTALDYEDNIASNKIIDELRSKMVCVEDKNFSEDYLDPDKRSIANGITIEFTNGKILDEVVVEYPIGHKFRREQGIPLLMDKFNVNLNLIFKVEQQNKIKDMIIDKYKFFNTPINEFINILCEGFK